MAHDVSVSSLEAGFIEMASIVRALHGDWSAPVAGYDGWTNKDLLAHLSSTEASLPAVANSVTEAPKPGAEPFDADRWNRSQVRKRADTDVQDLLDEFDAGTTRLVDLLNDIDLSRKVTIGAYPGYSLGEAMAEMLEHQQQHLADLRQSLHAHLEQ